jgi:hypothetical protein
MKEFIGRQFLRLTGAKMPSMFIGVLMLNSGKYRLYELFGRAS